MVARVEVLPLGLTRAKVDLALGERFEIEIHKLRKLLHIVFLSTYSAWPEKNEAWLNAY